MNETLYWEQDGDIGMNWATDDGDVLSMSLRDDGRIVFAVLLSDGQQDRKSTRLNSSHIQKSRMPSSA